MAVSAYAAQSETGSSGPAPATESEEQPIAGDAGVDVAYGSTSGWEGGVQGSGAEGLMAVQATMTAMSGAASEPTPAPTVELHYPPPDVSAPVTNMRSGRNNLSPGPRVWRGLSVNPQPRTAAQPASAGLDIPPDQLAVMQQVGLWTGVPWQVLAAIARVESDFGRNMSTSWAGAIGYGQFMPEMWAIYGNGGDPYDFNDVLPAMARYLLVAGAPSDMAGAIYAYNHSWEYVSQV